LYEPRCCLGAREARSDDAIFFESFRSIAFGFQGARVQKVPVRGLEIRIQADEIVESCTRGSRIAFSELGARQPEHEIRIMLVQTVEIGSMFADRFVVASRACECFGVALPARDIAGNSRFTFVAAQIRMRIERFLDTASRALRRSAAK